MASHRPARTDPDVLSRPNAGPRAEAASASGAASDPGTAAGPPRRAAARRRWSAVIGAAAGLVVGFAASPAGLIAAVPLAISVGTVCWVLTGWADTVRWLPCASLVCAAASLAATAVTFVVPYIGSPLAGLLGIAEVGGLLVLLAMVLRTAAARQAISLGVLLTAAALAWLLRIPPPPTTAAGLVTIMVWCAAPVTAAIAGGYPRLADARRSKSVEQARRAQRLQIAQDLHDFVAHDVTGIVVQAQAAQLVGRTDPALALAALQRIEAAGQHALDSMDRALELLRAQDDHATSGSGASAQDAAALLERFTVTGGPIVETHLDDDAWNALPRNVTAVLYRVLAEALTNVRRHAPGATWVRVDLTANSYDAVLTVTNPVSWPNDGRPPRGGSGLRHLADLVSAVGGSISARSTGGRWQTRLTVPAPGRSR